MNISLSSLRSAFQELEKDFEAMKQPGAQAHGQGQDASAADPTAVRAEKPINFGSPSDPSADMTQPKSADQKSAADAPESLTQLMETIMKAMMQFLQSLMQSSDSSGDDSGSTAPASASAAPAVRASDSGASGAGAPGAGAANGAAAPGPASGAAPANAVPGNSGVTGTSDLHLPPALEPYRADIEDAAQKTGMPANVIAGQIWAESRGDANAASTNVNGKTDGGLMQVNPDTYNEVKGENPDKFNGNAIHDNIMAGALYLRDQTKAFGGDIGAGLRAYNSGPDKVNRSNLADVGGVGDPDYVKNVENFAHIIGSGQGQLPA